jgi:hypothetical protein
LYVAGKRNDFRSKKHKIQQKNYPQQQRCQHISSTRMMKVHDALPKEALLAWEKLKAKTQRSIGRTQAGH